MSLHPGLAAVVFDLDGTLLDSFAAQIGSYRLAILDLDGPNYTDAEIVDAFALGSASQMMATLIGRPVGEEAVIRYETHLRSQAAAVSSYPGVEEALATLGRRFALAVFTAANTSAAEWLLQAAGLLGSFASVVGADLVARTKPSPDGLLLACERLGVAPGNAAYVGDAPVDVEAAHASGALSIMARWGHLYSPEHAGDLTADTPDDLVRLLIPELT
ncbi:MAG: HAD family hydrolase [Actinomycetota bacterium]